MSLLIYNFYLSKLSKYFNASDFLVNIPDLSGQVTISTIPISCNSILSKYIYIQVNKI